MTVNQRIKIIRERNKLSQGAFGEALGMSQSDVSKLESGESKFITNDVIQNLNAIYKVDLNWLFSENNTLSESNANYKTAQNEKETARENEKPITNPKNDQEMNRILQYQERTIKALEDHVESLVKANNDLLKRIELLENRRDQVKTGHQ